MYSYYSDPHYLYPIGRKWIPYDPKSQEPGDFWRCDGWFGALTYIKWEKKYSYACQNRHRYQEKAITHDADGNKRNG